MADEKDSGPAGAGGQAPKGAAAPGKSAEPEPAAPAPATAPDPAPKPAPAPAPHPAPAPVPAVNPDPAPAPGPKTEADVAAKGQPPVGAEGAPAVPKQPAPPKSDPPSPAGAVPPKPAAAAAPTQMTAGPQAGTTPAPKAEKDADALSRRSFMKWTLPVGWTAFTAAFTSGLVATGRFMFPNVLFEPPQSFKAGFPSEYNVGEVDTRWKDAFGVWIVREPDNFYAIIAVCTHLGCSPNWLPAENKFKCPCHGSGFYRSGVNFEGPAPRPLERARILLADDGQILVDKSVKFQQEKGEWEKAESFLKV